MNCVNDRDRKKQKKGWFEKKESNDHQLSDNTNAGARLLVTRSFGQQKKKKRNQENKKLLTNKKEKETNKLSSDDFKLERRSKIKLFMQKFQ
jgi:hypothetical protein